MKIAAFTPYGVAKSIGINDIKKKRWKTYKVNKMPAPLRNTSKALNPGYLFEAQRSSHCVIDATQYMNISLFSDNSTWDLNL